MRMPCQVLPRLCSPLLYDAPAAHHIATHILEVQQRRHEFHLLQVTSAITRSQSVTKNYWYQLDAIG